MGKKSEGRTAKSIRNAKVAFVFYCFNILLTFFSRKVFIDYLGADVLGLNTTAGNLLGFLNLAEFGVAVAVGYSLYGPLFRGDRRTIAEIVSVQGYLYRIIALLIGLAAVVLICFFPLIFSNVELPVWMPYATFAVFLLGAMTGYLWNYKTIVLDADQKGYVHIFWRQGLVSLKVLFQILAIRYLPDGYVWWIVLEGVFAVLITWALSRAVKRNYPWLRTSASEGKALRRNYPQLLVKTKQIFVHRIGDFAVVQVAPLFVFAFVSLSAVAVFGNYWVLANAMIFLFNALFNNLNAGVGNLVAEGNTERTESIFWEIFSVRLLLTTAACFLVAKIATPFMRLWIGADFLLPASSVILISATLFLMLVRGTTDSFLNAYGLFSDVAAPVVQTILIVGLSVGLGAKYGLDGILAAGLISYFLLFVLWKPYFLVTRGFRRKAAGFMRRYVFLLLMMAGAVALSEWTLRTTGIVPGETWFRVIAYGVFAAATAGGISGAVLYLCSGNFRKFVTRLIRYR